MILVEVSFTDLITDVGVEISAVTSTLLLLFVLLGRMVKTDFLHKTKMFKQPWEKHYLVKNLNSMSISFEMLHIYQMYTYLVSSIYHHSKSILLTYLDLCSWLITMSFDYLLFPSGSHYWVVLQGLPLAYNRKQKIEKLTHWFLLMVLFPQYLFLLYFQRSFAAFLAVEPVTELISRWSESLEMYSYHFSKKKQTLSYTQLLLHSLRKCVFVTIKTTM